LARVDGLNHKVLGDQDRRHAANLAADIFSAPAVFALDAEQLVGEFGARRC
jgi:hypothetical protein